MLEYTIEKFLDNGFGEKLTLNVYKNAGATINIVSLILLDDGSDFLFDETFSYMHSEIAIDDFNCAIVSDSIKHILDRAW